MHFGIFHTALNIYPDVFYEMLNGDFVDVFLSEGEVEDQASVEMLKAIHEKGKKLYVSFFFWAYQHVYREMMVDVGSEYSARVVLRDGWQETVDAKIAFLRASGHWEAVEGFYIDEPLLNGITLEDFRTVTAYLRERCPDKRIFCCFSIAGVAPDVWTANNVKPITPEAGQYLTDVAFDMYHKFDEKYAYITSEMKRRLGNREDLRIWQVPCTMNYRGDKDEQHCLDHLNGCYELLKKEKNPGGLMCFTFYTFPAEVEALGNIGLDHLRGKNPGDANWSRLYERIKEIGRECIHSEK